MLRPGLCDLQQKGLSRRDADLIGDLKIGRLSGWPNLIMSLLKTESFLWLLTSRRDSSLDRDSTGKVLADFEMKSLRAEDLRTASRS